MVRPRLVTDHQILDAARACFLTHGPGVSTSHIAKELGVSQATLFKRFGSKDALMLKALHPGNQAPDWDALGAPPDGRPVPEQLVERGVVVLRFLNVILPCIAVLRAHSAEMTASMVRSDNSPPRRALQATAAFFDALVADGRMAPCDTESVAIMWLGALRNHAFWSTMMPDLALSTQEQYVQVMAQTFWQGLGPKEIR